MAESFVLNTGARIPSAGLGTWQIEPGAVSDAIYAAVKSIVFAGFLTQAGYRHIDSAVAYRNQKEVRLLKVEFVVHPKSGYNSLDDLWDGEVEYGDERTENQDHSDFLRCFS